MTYAEHVAAGGTDEELMEILSHVHLAYLPDREGGWTTRKEWKDVLSGGERQRVSIVISDELVQTLSFGNTVDGNGEVVLSPTQVRDSRWLVLLLDC